jgi:hypothetical protein
MDIRDMLIDGISQLNDWLGEALEPMTLEQLNQLSDGKTTSAGFNAWHILRTQDNITNFVLKRATPIWIEKGYFEQFGLPKVDQGTGMSLEDARATTINNAERLREYNKEVGASCIAFLKDVPLADLEEVQMIKPLGEMSKARVLRQVVMTHGFMHLGEINHIKGSMGMQFSI